MLDAQAKLFGLLFQKRVLFFYFFEPCYSHLVILHEIQLLFFRVFQSPGVLLKFHQNLLGLFLEFLGLKGLHLAQVCLISKLKL